MSCVEKRHMGHRMGSMLHHRFPNGFTDLFMDETDREVSTLTDRAFRSLCVGDDAVYNDEFLYGYSPFSCHKPLAGEPLKKCNNKESKKQEQNKNKQQLQKNISNMSSFLKAFSATEESCEGMLIKNGALPDSNGESWDKSALRSIQRELSEFSSDYQTNLTGGNYKNHHNHHGSSNKTGKDAAPPSGKVTKNKNGKPTVKLRKLIIKNFFLHSEFSPFQAWRDFNQFPFGHEDTLSTDKIPKWYDLPFYKELTEAHRKETLHTEEVQSSQKATVEPPPPTAPKPNPPPPPPKVLPKPSATPAEKRCSSDGGEGTAAPWRRNRSRATSVIPVNQPGAPPQENTPKMLDESLFLVKKEARSVEVKAVEEVSSVASTPFSICQLMTPLIPSRQPTETSEILQAVLSPSALDLPLRPHSEAKVTPEPPVKRDSYKSLASSILFNLKDNRKRVKSRYSPPKFKNLDALESGTQSPQPDVKYPQTASGLSTPAILKEGQMVCSPVVESNSTPVVGITKYDADRPLSDDYLLSNLLQTGNTLGEDNPISPLIPLRKTKSPAKKQNYPSLNLYKKANPVEDDMNYLQVPQSSVAPSHVEQPTEHSPLLLNKELSPKPLPKNTVLSPNTLNVIKDPSPKNSPNILEREGLLSNVSVRKRPSNAPDKTRQSVPDIREKDFGEQPVSPKENYTSSQPISTMDVIRAAKEAINAAKDKALSAAQITTINKPISDIEELGVTEIENRREDLASETHLSKIRNEETGETLVDKNVNIKKDPPPVPKRHFSKSDIQFPPERQQTHNVEKLTNGDLADARPDLSPKESESVPKQSKSKHIFSARQNNYIKNQRYAETDDDQGQDFVEGNLKVTARTEAEEGMKSPREIRDSEHIISDLHSLKELQRAKLGDRMLDNARKKLSHVRIDEEARVKNELISRELRNIKKGMLSMRGNTSAKRELFGKKDREESKPDGFSRVDSNVVVNKALLNDNYDKAKMALEEIISERQRRKNEIPEQDTNPIFDDNAGHESYVKRVQQRKNAMKDSMTEAKEKQNSNPTTVKERDLKERLGDLRDHNHMRQILSQTEPRLGETYKAGGRSAQTGKDNELNTLLKNNADEELTFSPSYETEELHLRHRVRQISEGSGENLMNQKEDRGGDVPLVPPRSKKGGVKGDVSVSKEIESAKDFMEEDIFNKEVAYENSVVHSKEIQSAGSEKHDRDSDLFIGKIVASQRESSLDNERWDVINNTSLKSPSLNNVLLSQPSKYTQSEIMFGSTPEIRENESKATDSQADMSPTRVKRKAPLKPDLLNTAGDNVTKDVVTEVSDKMKSPNQDVNATEADVPESPRSIISPLLLVNGQSPPDQSSLSSKSSYFSAESALHRNTESESNIYHSLENLIGEVDEDDDVTQEISQNAKQDSDRTEAEYYSFSDHESETEMVKQLLKSPQRETEAPCMENKERENTTTEQSFSHDESHQTPMSPSSMFSPNLGIPSLFKVKDNTFSNKMKKIQPWSPRGGLLGSERGEEVLHQVQEAPEPPLVNDPDTTRSTSMPDETLKPSNEVPSVSSPPIMLSPPTLQHENTKKPQFGGFLTVPQEEDRFSGVSPSSEGVESVTTDTCDTADETGVTGDLVEPEVTKVPSERSGSTCSGNDSQTGLPKPPAVLPKSEKAVLKAIKLANRRMKKEEAQKSSHKSSQSSGKSRADRHKGDKSEHKGSSGSRNSKSSERRHREKIEDGHHHSESQQRKNSDNLGDQLIHDRRGNSKENQQTNIVETRPKTRRQSHDSVGSSNQSGEALPSVPTERQGRSSHRNIRERPEQRHYSSDRVISNVPVYKAHISDRPASDRPFNRSQSTDRYLGDKVERRLSTDASVAEKLDPRTQRIEKSIMDELQQRGRARDKASRDNPMRRSHSIDAYSTEAAHPSNLSRQSSHTSQLSRQSSIEHAIVTQSFPMTQRKLLQDPDSGQYFFVDMPVQVKTKTFFDPETGSYVQLPVQPPEGALPQAPPLEVLTPPMVVYHSFVPVPLSPMAQKATIQAPHMTAEEYGQRQLERSRQMHCKERNPYLEPVYGQHDLMLGEFLGTEELDCPS